MSDNFKFVTVLKTGGKDFSEIHVEWLCRQIGFPIYCLTDSTKPMKDVISIPLKYNLSGWWSKIELFRPDLGLGNFMFSDLDTVFLNGIPEEYKKLEETTVLHHVGRKPVNHICSGLLFINQKDCPKVWDNFIKDSDNIMKKYKIGGDQAYLSEHLMDCQKWQTLFPGEIVSYKADIKKDGFKGKERICLMHGSPRPWEISQVDWIPPLIK
jgi:hypothetical protein